MHMTLPRSLKTMNKENRNRGLLAHQDAVKAIQICSKNEWRIDDLAKAISLKLNRPILVCRNTVLFFIEIGSLTRSNSGRVSNNSGSPDSDSISGKLQLSILDSFLSKFEAQILPESFKFDPAERRMLINRLLVPGRELEYPYALLEFGVFERGNTMETHWRISQRHEPVFKSILKTRYNESQKKKTSLASLKARLAQQEAAGLMAEEWVCDYERRRLLDHPLLEQVGRISDLDVSAGYDIESFETLESAVIDRFIEVKSFSKNIEFYWSENEMNIAQNLGTQYWLYLVDRTNLDAPNYQPIKIRDPWSHFIRRKPIGWNSSTVSLKFTKKPTDA